MTVVRVLAHPKGSTSKRLGGIPTSALKSLGKYAAMQMSDIFRAILRGEEPVPQDWLLGRVVQIPKRGGDEQYLRDYRPLTVTSTVCRTCAHIFKELMTAQAEKNELLTELQGGFCRGRRLEDNCSPSHSASKSPERRKKITLLLSGCGEGW